MSTPWFLPAPLIDITALALWWGLLRLSRRHDNRRLRNGVLFLLLVGSAARALLHLASLIPALKVPVDWAASPSSCSSPSCRSCSCSTASSSSAARGGV